MSSNPKVTVTVVPLMAGVDDSECIWGKAGKEMRAAWVSVEHCQLGSKEDILFNQPGIYPGTSVCSSKNKRTMKNH